MKTYCKRLDIGREFVAEAYVRWRASQAGKKNEWRVSREHGGADALIDEIAAEIHGRCLTFAPIRYEERFEGTGGKLRRIGIECVKQQVVEHVVMLAIEPLWKAKLGAYQTAGVRGRGQVCASRAIRRWCDKMPRGYYVKADIRKCYESTSHEVVRGYYAKHIRSADVLYCVDALLATVDGGCGLNLGGAFSLVTMTLLLADAYHYVEGLGRRRRGKWVPLAVHQLWFMDDILLMGGRKADVRSAARKLEAFLAERYGLHLKPWKVCRIDAEPIDMCGFVNSPRKTGVRGRIFVRAGRAFRRFGRHPCVTLARRAVSYWGFLAHADTWRWAVKTNAHAVRHRASRLISSTERLEHTYAC